MNRTQHAVGATITIGLATAIKEYEATGRVSEKTVFACLVGTQLGSIPDWIEPATSPNHRQFFHSWAFLAAVGYGGYKLYCWEPEEDWQRLLKVIGLLICIGYATHLLMDSTTRRGLPVI